MVCLDLCLDHNRGVVSVCSTERGGGGSESMDQKRCREVGMGLFITNKTGREVGWGWLCPWIGSATGYGSLFPNQHTKTRPVTLRRLSSHITSPKVVHYITDPIIIM